MPVVLHIGTGKTGTSSVQRFLYDNRHALRERGLVYPETGLTIIDHFGESIAAHYRLVEWIKRRDKDTARQLRAVSEQAGAATVIFSCENFYHHLLPEDIQFLKSSLADQAVQIVCYVRPQDRYIESAWKQQVKVGEIRVPFKHFLERHCSADFLSESHANYHRKLAPWADCFGGGQIKLRIFDSPSFINGRLVDDFLQACGTDLRGDEFGDSAAGPSNKALPTELALLLRFSNWRRYFEVKQQASFVSFLEQSFVFENQAMLSPAEREAVLENYRIDNEQMFARYGGLANDAALPSCFEPHIGTGETPSVTALPLPDDIALRCLIQLWKQQPFTAQGPTRQANPSKIASWWEKWSQNKG